MRCCPRNTLRSEVSRSNFQEVSHNNSSVNKTPPGRLRSLGFPFFSSKCRRARCEMHLNKVLARRMIRLSRSLSFIVVCGCLVELFMYFSAFGISYALKFQTLQFAIRTTNWLMPMFVPTESIRKFSNEHDAARIL